MRISLLSKILLNLFVFTLTFSSVKAQEMLQKKINVGFNSVSLIDALQRVEKNSGYHFYYRKDDLKSFVGLSLPLKERTIKETLEEILLKTPFTFRQTGTYIQIEKSAKPERKILGKISSITDHKPLVYASVQLLCGKDLSIIIQNYTDSTGQFELKTTDSAALTLKIITMNYTSKSIRINAGTEDIFLKEVSLEPQTQQLKEVVVTASNPIIERKADRFVVNVSNTSMAAATNVWDALGRAPLVNARDGGAVSIIGKQTAIIYIDGRKSNLSGESLYNYLKSLPASNLKNIEIITSPGSEFDASGNSGIVNINFKKRESDGLLGAVSVSNIQQTFNTIRSNASLNYRKKNLGINAVVYGNRIKQNITENSVINFLNLGKSGLLNPTDAERPETKNFYGGNVSIDYNLSAKQLLSATVDYSYNDQHLLNNTTSSFIDNSKLQTDSAFYSTNNRKITGHTLDVGINYRIQLDSLGHLLNISGDYFNFHSFSDQYLLAQLLGSNINRQDEYALLPQNINNYTFSIDHTLPFSSTSTLKSGLRSFNTDTRNDLAYTVNNGSGVYLPDPVRSSDYKYNEHVNAIYSTFNKSWSKKIATTIGLRMEISNTNGREVNHNITVDKNYINLFPNFNLSFTPDKDNQFSYSLTNRIDRPSFGQLNTNRIYYNPTRYAEGNPFLQPAYMLKNEITYSLKSKYIFVISYNHTRNAFSQFILTNDSTNQVRFTQLNYGSIDEANLAFVTSQQWGKIGSSALTAVGNFTHYKGSANNEIIDNSGLSAILKLNSSFFLLQKKKLTAYVDLNYSSRQVLSLGSQGRAKATGSVDIGFRKVIDQFTLVLYGTDILRTSENRYVFKNTYTNNSFKNYYDNRGVEFTVRYNFGNNKLKKNQNRENINRDIRNRSGN